MASGQQLPEIAERGMARTGGKGTKFEPAIDLDTMIGLTTKRIGHGAKFDGMDLFLFDSHVSIDIDDDGIKRLADKFQSNGLAIGLVVAPVWNRTGGGSATADEAERKEVR